MLCHTDCSPRLDQLFSSPWCRQTLAEPLAQVSWQLQLHQSTGLLIPSASQDPSFHIIIALVVFLKIWVLFLGLNILALCAVFSAVLLLFHVTGGWYFFSLKCPLFQIQFPNYFMERSKVSSLCFITYIWRGGVGRHGNRKDSFREQVQTNKWEMSSSY